MDAVASPVRGAKHLAPASRPGRRAEDVERKGSGRKEMVAEQGRLVVKSNGRHRSRLGKALEKRRAAEEELVSNVVVHLEAVSLAIAARTGDHDGARGRLH